MTRLGAMFRRKDWVPGLLAVAAVLALHGTTNLIQHLEHRWYDHGVRTTVRAPSDEVAVIAIDDASVARLGNWPWSRRLLAEMVDRLGSAGARTIVLALPLAEPQIEPGLRELEKLAEVVDGDVDLASHPVLPLLLELSRRTLDADAHLRRAVQDSQRTLLAAPVAEGPGAAGPVASTLPAGTAGLSLPDPGAGLLAPLGQARWPLPALAAVAAGVGPLALQPDADGVLRSHALLQSHEGRAIASLALLAAARQRQVPLQQLRLLPGSVQLGNTVWPTERLARLRTHFYSAANGGAAAPVAHEPFHAVHSGAVPAARYARKTVLIGMTAAEGTARVATPVAPAMSALDVLAHQTSALLAGHVVYQPAWGPWATLAAVLAVVLYLVAVVPRLAAVSALALTTVLAIALLATGHLLQTESSMWVRLVLPVVTLVAGQAAMTARRLALAPATLEAADAADATGVHTARLLGLSLQNQGQHEMAWDQLRRVPLALLEPAQAQTLMERLYELALNLEHRGQEGLAQEVYAHLVRHDQGYRDVAQRLLRSRAPGGDEPAGAGLPPPTLAPTMDRPLAPPAAEPRPPEPRPAGVTTAGTGAAAGPPRQTLGRFRIERELGRGAMGAVYLGLDPQWNRPVAIKTMALSQEFGGEQLADARQRFLREAETAGRLRHPDIVTIYDAGEDRDLAYIAMELLSGHDLTAYTRPGHLLPVPQVLQLTARVAEALAYAHKQGVVHRDVKPANVMIDPARDQVKVTDFGIARITDSSKTRTGAVLGTPSYMSPEQLAGRRLDGRSDLYSLGVMLFQLLTGHLPNRGESMAALMYAIANTPAPDVRTLRPDLPQTLAEVVALALEKRPEVRYADGQQLALDLRTVAAMMDTPAPGGVPAPPPMPPAGLPAPSPGPTPQQLRLYATGDISLATARPPATATPAAPPVLDAAPAPTAPAPAAAAPAAAAPTPAPTPTPTPEHEAAAPLAAANPEPPVPTAPAADASAQGVRGVWRSSVRKARREAQAELFADTQPSMPVPLDDDGFGHNRPG